jgi:hypothetical protein
VITGPAKFDILLKIRVTTAIWIYVLYDFIKKKNFPAVAYALKKISDSNGCIRKLGFDLHQIVETGTIDILTHK